MAGGRREVHMQRAPTFRTPRRPRPVKGARNAFYFVLNFRPCAEGRPTTQGGELQSGVRKVRQNMSCVCACGCVCVCACGRVCVCRRAVTLCDVRPLARAHGPGTKTLRGVMRTTTGQRTNQLYKHMHGQRPSPSNPLRVGNMDVSKAITVWRGSRRQRRSPEGRVACTSRPYYDRIES